MILSFSGARFQYIGPNLMLHGATYFVRKILSDFHTTRFQRAQWIKTIIWLHWVEGAVGSVVRITVFIKIDFGYSENNNAIGAVKDYLLEHSTISSLLTCWILFTSTYILTTILISGFVHYQYYILSLKLRRTAQLGVESSKHDIAICIYLGRGEGLSWSSARLIFSYTFVILYVFFAILTRILRHYIIYSL